MAKETMRKERTFTTKAATCSHDRLQWCATRLGEQSGRARIALEVEAGLAAGRQQGVQRTRGRRDTFWWRGPCSR